MTHAGAACQPCRPGADYTPPRALEQVNRWAMLVLALLFRVLCNERPSDISMYHLGCFKLQAPDHSSTHLASVALAALQPDADHVSCTVHSANEMLEAYRAAGAVLLIRAPKCKQSERKRSRGRAAPLQRIEWLAVRKRLLPPELALWDPIDIIQTASWMHYGAAHQALLYTLDCSRQ
jgi:hypothetical protein